MLWVKIWIGAADLRDQRERKEKKDLIIVISLSIVASSLSLSLSRWSFLEKSSHVVAVFDV